MNAAWSTVSATGHRPQHLTRDEQCWVQAELVRIVLKLRDEYGMTTGVSGMALGVDMWWAADLVDADVPLWAHVPFPQQPDRWTMADQIEWRRLYDLAKQVTVYGDHYDVKLLHARNDGMLDVSDAVVAVYKPSKPDGGTASAFRKATRRGLPVVHINPERRSVTLINPAADVAPKVAALRSPTNA